MRHLLFAVSISLGFVESAYGLAFPEHLRAMPPAPYAASSEFAAYDFEGILQLNNCSGSLVRFDDSRDTDLAMVMTNGHCVQMMPPGSAMVNQKSSRSFTVLDHDGAGVGTVRAQKLLYATLTKTDIGLYQLTETYRDIGAKYNTGALTFARAAPSLETDIEIISGYWKRGYSCHVEAVIYNVKEDGYVWQNSIRFSRPGCDTIGGTSGSPVVAAGTRTVVAVNNTGNESGGKCTENNPCEVDQNGKVFYQKGYSYAQQTYWLYSCRNGKGLLDFTVAGCPLPK